MQNKKEIVASLPPSVILLRTKPILGFGHLSEQSIHRVSVSVFHYLYPWCLTGHIALL